MKRSFVKALALILSVLMLLTACTAGNTPGNSSSPSASETANRPTMKRSSALTVSCATILPSILR